MSILGKEIQAQVMAALADMTAPVKLVLFTQGAGGAVECQFCSETRQLLEEITELSDLIRVEVRDLVDDGEAAEVYGIDKVPAIIVMPDSPGAKDYGIRLFGIPSGYEFSTLVEDILMVSQGDPRLSAETLDALRSLNKPTHIQVFVTPTCPYCPRAVVLAHRLAMASDFITADMVEATEFPHLANRYHVYGVPRTVINEVIHIEGAIPENHLLLELQAVMNEERMQQLEAEWAAHPH